MGFRPHKRKDALTFAASSGGAEAFMTFVGALLGAKIVASFSSVDHWIAFGLLFLVAAHMAYEGIDGLRSEKEQKSAPAFHSFFKILIVSFATSFDALGVGVGLGVGQKPIILYTFAIGFLAFLATIAGMHLAQRVSSKFGDIFTLVGAGVLLVMAFKMLAI